MALPWPAHGALADKKAVDDRIRIIGGLFVWR